MSIGVPCGGWGTLNHSVNILPCLCANVKRKEKRKSTPIHCTSVNVSPLSICLTRQAVLSHEDLCLAVVTWIIGGDLNMTERSGDKSNDRKRATSDLERFSLQELLYT
jgi:hypothetical protein